MLLARHFAAKMAFEIGRSEVPTFSEGAVTALESYAWPGNVRELKNVVERAVYRSDSPAITQIVFNPFRPLAGGEVSKADHKEVAFERGTRTPLKKAVQEVEVGLLKEALEESKYNQRKAAKRLGLTYHQLRGLLRKYKEARFLD